MTDTNDIEVLRSALVRIAMGVATTRTLSARASAGEGGDTRCDQYVLDSFNGARKCMNKRAPGDTLCKKHRATAEQTGYTAAPQPAQAGDSGGAAGPRARLRQHVMESVAKSGSGAVLVSAGEVAALFADYDELAAAPRPQERDSRDMVRTEITREDFGPAGEPGDTNYQRWLDQSRTTQNDDPESLDILEGVLELHYPRAKKHIQMIRDYIAELRTTRPTTEAREARDAARYRAIRNAGWEPNGNAALFAAIETAMTGEQLDDCIDAALALPAQGEG